MATDLRTIRSRVQLNLNDTDRRPVYEGPVVDQEIAKACLILGGKLPAPKVYSASAFTISAGSDLFQLPATVTQWTGNDGGAEYRADVRIRLVSTGDWLTKADPEELESFRTGPTVTLGRPRLYCLWEEKDQDLIGRCYPGAQAAEACDVFVGLSTDDPRDYVGSGTDDMNDVEVMFSRQGAVALELYVSASLLGRMHPELAVQRGLDKAIVPVWFKTAEDILYREAGRLHDAASTGRIQRWTR